MNLEFSIAVHQSGSEPRVHVETGFGWGSEFAIKIAPPTKEVERSHLLKVLEKVYVMPAYNLSGNEEVANNFDLMLKQFIVVMKEAPLNHKSAYCFEMDYDGGSICIRVTAFKSPAQPKEEKLNNA